jgi:thiol-disulfide isomerase/thioredoxin
MEPAEYNPGGDGGHSVWWEWTAPTTERYFATTQGSDFDTRMMLTTDTEVLDWNDDDVGLTSGIHFKAEAGVRYYISVQGYGGAIGKIHLEIRPDPPVRAPAWTLTDMNGQTLRLSDFAGKVVMLDFWATWCGPCVSEIPDLIAMQNEYGPDGFVIIGVSTDQNGFADVTPFVAANGVNYISTLWTAQIERDYGPISAIPTTFVIDRQGMIDQRLVGSRSRGTFDSILLPLIYPEMKLQVVRDGNSIVVSWPLGPDGYVLESCLPSNPTNWAAVADAVTVSAANNTIRLAVDQSQRWFRLVKN